MEKFQEILSYFISDAKSYQVRPFGTGLIHHTYLVSKNDEPVYILQEVNYLVFKNPQAIAENISNLTKHIKKYYPEEIFPSFINTRSGHSYHYVNNQPYRLSTFVSESHSIDTCTDPDQAYEAAFQFGKFTSMFDGFNLDVLQDTIPQFHDLNFRWQQFEDAIKNGNQSRIDQTKIEIDQIQQHKYIVDQYNSLIASGILKRRVTHHDTKISNVLLNDQNKGICVIDLDTTMPGYFISDLGDMFRTYLSEATEEEQQLEKVIARRSYYDAIIQGYSSAMSNSMTKNELEVLNFSGQFMIYMQALRFLTDYINDDRYYGARYELHNLNRAKNQLKLLSEFIRITS